MRNNPFQVHVKLSLVSERSATVNNNDDIKTLVHVFQALNCYTCDMLLIMVLHSICGEYDTYWLGNKLSVTRLTFSSQEIIQELFSLGRNIETIEKIKKLNFN